MPRLQTQLRNATWLFPQLMGWCCQEAWCTKYTRCQGFRNTSLSSPSFMNNTGPVSGATRRNRSLPSSSRLVSPPPSFVTREHRALGKGGMGSRKSNTCYHSGECVCECPPSASIMIQAHSREPPPHVPLAPQSHPSIPPPPRP